MLEIYKNSIQQSELKKLKHPEKHTWIHAVNPTEKEIQGLGTLLAVPLDTIQDSLDMFELPRIQVEGKSVVVILRTPMLTEKNFTTRPLTIVIHPDYVATIAPENVLVTDDIVNRIIRITTTQRSHFLITVALRIIYYYQRYITSINRAVQQERAHLKNITQADIVKLIETEETLNSFIGSITPTIATIKKLLTYNYINLYPQDKELIDDVLIDGEQVRELCLTNLKTVRNIRDGYSTVMSIRLNQTMKVLTYITAFLTIPLIVTSIYGMNIALPLASSPHAFIILSVITIFLIVIALLLFVFFKKKI